MFQQWAWVDSNHRPHAYQALAERVRSRQETIQVVGGAHDLPSFASKQAGICRDQSRKLPRESREQPREPRSIGSPASLFFNARSRSVSTTPPHRKVQFSISASVRNCSDMSARVSTAQAAPSRPRPTPEGGRPDPRRGSVRGEARSRRRASAAGPESRVCLLVSGPRGRRAR